MRNRVSFCHSTVKGNIHHRNPVSWLSRLVSETGFLFVTPQLTIISTTETRFLFLGKPGFLVIPRIQKPGFFLSLHSTGNIHHRNPVSWFLSKSAIAYFMGFRNRVSFCNSTVGAIRESPLHIHNRNPVSFLGDKPGCFSGTRRKTPFLGCFTLNEKKFCQICVKLLRQGDR
ncbi:MULTISPECIES: hypothetical protein [Planktothricoides]|uniref:Uncharacterized protein n=1 Tax=Planktothricoides raciborskii FACHB-1370 TaxID=2949576 RepID=A0ABR8EJD4_9CYAN|nr:MULTISPECIES: hypothetical protein [Planktothricoides]MBD2546239.1 hypothetical protein [Planktothricoides raciborskii FACHB-1370]MBD2584514.1 hypothetical protein [Planktothricoides raciborskii FACHB-1261]